MKVENVTKHDVEQGSDEWLELRDNFVITASKLPTIMGYKGKDAYDDLVKECATGEKKELDDFTKKLFADGHRFEELARVDAEEYLESKLDNPVFTGTVGGIQMLASLDGLTSDGYYAWECKTYNKKIADCTIETLPVEYKPQMTLQMALSGAKSCLFTGANANKIDHVGFFGFNSDYLGEIVKSCEVFLMDILNYKKPDKIETEDVVILAERYFELKAKHAEIANELKLVEDEIKAMAEGKDEIQLPGLVVKKMVRKGSVDYGKIELLDGVDLEKYRKQGSVFYQIKESK